MIRVIWKRSWGGYDPALRWLLARAERKGGYTGRKKEMTVLMKNENGGNDGVLDHERPSLSGGFFPITSSPKIGEDGRF